MVRIKGSRVGHEFLRAFSACFGLVQRHPEIFPIVKGYRKGLPRKFPFTFFYRCENNLVTVYQVFHCSQDSRKWTKGLQVGDCVLGGAPSAV